MTAPVRIRLRRTKGWKMPENTVKVDRTTKWGNPFPVKGVPPLLNPPAWVVLCHSYWILGLQVYPNKPTPPTLAEIQAALRGKNLACWCPVGAACHADVLLELANGGAP